MGGIRLSHSVRVISLDVGLTLLRPYPSFGEIVVGRCIETGLTMPPGAAAGVAPDEIVHVGDSLIGDVRGALDAGLQAVLVDRDGRYPDSTPCRIINLTDLLDLL